MIKAKREDTDLHYWPIWITLILASISMLVIVGRLIFRFVGVESGVYYE